MAQAPQGTLRERNGSFGRSAEHCCHSRQQHLALKNINEAIMLESGQTLSARYSLVRRLGAGGHGEVWLAADRERQGYAALKIIDPALANALDAFAATCERVQRLDHPNILK